MIHKSALPLCIVLGLRLAATFLSPRQIASYLEVESTQRLVTHRDAGVRKAAWNYLRSIKGGVVTALTLGEAFAKEEHLEVINSALAFFNDISTDKGTVISVVEERRLALKDTILALSDKWSQVAAHHPILLGRLFKEDGFVLTEEQAMAMPLRTVVQLTKGHPLYMAKLSCDVKIALIERSLRRADDPNEVYAGLSFLCRIVKQLGGRIAELQGLIGNALGSDDVEIAFTALYALLEVPNASNWERLLGLARSLLERTIRDDSTYYWRLKVAGRLLEITIEFCHDPNQQAILIEEIISLYTERTTFEDIQEIKEIFDAHPEARQRAHPMASRVAILAGFAPRDPDPCRAGLLKEEVDCSRREGKEDALMRELATSIFYHPAPPSTASLSSSEASSPGVTSVAMLKLPIDDDVLPAELIMDIFTGFREG